MTWDHIDMAVTVGIALLAMAALCWAAFGFFPRLRSSERGRRTVASLFALGALAALPLAWYYCMGVASGQYPGLLEAYDRAPSEQQAAMRDVVIQAWPRRTIFSFSRAQRDRFLAAGDYCRVAWEPGCRTIPIGSEAEGLAIERFPYIARWGKSWPQEEPCHPRRCPK